MATNWYSSTNRALEGPTLKLRDFSVKKYSSSKKKFSLLDKKSFYFKRGKTVLLCKLMLTVEERMKKVNHWLITMSRRGQHAEQVFITEANKVLTNERVRYHLEEMELVILVSYSPCFKCRQELEHFLTRLVNTENIKVELTLRLGRLYTDGYNKKEAERMLTLWMNDLETKGVTLNLEVINVLKELPLAKLKKKKRNNRKKMDTKMTKYLDNVKRCCHDAQSLSKKAAKAPLKDGDSMALGKLTVSAFIESQYIPTTVIKLEYKKQGRRVCPGKRIITEATLKLPKCWTAIRKSLLLVSTHMPCSVCQATITDFLIKRRVTGKNNKLFLYLTNLHSHDGTKSTASFAKWIKRLEGQSVDVHLQLLPGIPITQGLRDQFELLKEQLADPFSYSSFPDSLEEFSEGWTSESEYTHTQEFSVELTSESQSDF